MQDFVGKIHWAVTQLKLGLVIMIAKQKIFKFRWRTLFMLPDDFFKKNMEMWEKFTSSYMDSMFKTVEKTLEQSKTFKERVDKAVASAMETQLEATLSALET